MHDLHQKLVHWKSGSQYKHGFWINSRRFESGFICFDTAESKDDFFSQIIHCQCGLVPVWCFLTYTFDMLKYIFWVSLCSVWFIFGECNMCFCDNSNIWQCTAISRSDPTLVLECGVCLVQNTIQRWKRKDWNIPVFWSCRFPLLLVMSEFWRVPRMERKCVRLIISGRLICAAFYLVFEDFMRKYGLLLPAS